MSRRNRNNRYNSRNRNKWDEGYDDEYFDDDDQLESEDDESSEDQDEYEDEEYEDDEEYDSDDEEYEEDESDEDEYEYDEDDDEEYDEDESDDEEYDDDDEEYDEDESDEEESDEEDDDEDDELESEIEAAAESTAKKSIGNSDLLSKLRGQMRPQIKDEQSDSSNDVQINVSPLSLFGQPISQNDKKSNTSSVPPQHANARIVQTVTVGKPSQAAPNASVQKAGSGRVITAQSQNGASVTSVQPRDLAAEKAEADKKQKEKERLEQEKKTKAEKSARILNKFKGRNSSGDSSQSVLGWAWSKIASGAVWIWAGIAGAKPHGREDEAMPPKEPGAKPLTSKQEPTSSGFLWILLTPKRAWQNWRIFNRSWWSGVWNTAKKPFVNTPDAEAAQTDGAEVVPSGSAVGLKASQPATVSRRKSRKKNVDIWDADSTAGSDADAKTDAFASTEPDSRRRLYFSLGSIGAAAVLFLLVLPSMLNGSKKSDENAVALNEQENVTDASNQNVNKPVSDAVPVSENGLDNSNQGFSNQGFVNRNEATNGNAFNSPNGDMRTGYSGSNAPSTNGNNFNSPRGDMRTGYPGSNAPSINGNNFNSPRGDMRTGYPTGGAPSNYNATSYPQRSTNQTPADQLALPAPEFTAPDITAPEVPDLGMDDSELTAPEVPTPEVTDLGLDDSELTAPEVTAPEVTDLGLDDSELPAPEVTAPEVTDLGLDDSELPTPDQISDEVPVPDDVSDVPVPDLSDSELEAPSVDLETPEIPEAEETPQTGDDPFKGVTPDFSEDSDVTAPSDADLAPTPELTSVAEPSADEADLPAPDVDVPDLTMPELSETQPVDSNPEEELTAPEPTIPEPAIPEPTEPNALETGVASELTEPVLEPEIPSTPDESLPNDSQLADSPTEMTPADSSVELGAPGPLVSSQKTTSAPSTPSTPSTPELATRNSQLATSNDNNSYANNYNSASGYNNQTYVNTGTYTVRPNDSFWTIAKRVYGSGEYARALAQYNSSRVDPQSLTVSAQIMTPPAETLEQQFPGLCPSRGLTSSAASTATAAPAGTRVYIVDQEESVMEIARRELGSILYCSQVYALNQEQLSGNVDRVKPGVRLLLPIQK